MEVLVLGGFDCLHWGHILFLREASKYGELVVGLSSDRLLAETKHEPWFSYNERKEALTRLGYRVVERDETSVEMLVRQFQPDVFACGSDWLDQPHLEAAGLTVKFLEDRGVTVVYIPRSHDMSTTRIVETIRGTR